MSATERVARTVGAVAVACAALALLAPPAFADTGSISGTVLGATGANGCPITPGCPLTGATVYVFTPGGNTPVAGPASTDSNGKYTVSGLAAPGSYVVEFTYTGSNPPGPYSPQWYNDQPSESTANSVPVSSGQTTPNIDATLQSSSGGGAPTCSSGTGSISGTATSGLTGKPLRGITVQLTISPCGGSASTPTTTTNAAGAYTFAGLPAGSGYDLYFQDVTGHNYNGVYDPQFYNDQSSLQNANRVTVTAGQTTSGINAVMQVDPKYTIIGTITNARTGAPLDGADAYVQTRSGGTVTGPGDVPGDTDAGGTYGIAAPPGTYVVAFHGPTAPPTNGQIPAAEYETQYYNGKSTLATADLVTVTSGHLTQGIDAALGPPGSITGTVRNSATGRPAGGIEVNFQPIGSSPYAFGANFSPVKTDSSGRYTIVVANAGTYEVGFVDKSGRLAGQYNGGGVEAGSPVPVSGGQTKTINQALPPAGSISGAATTPSLSQGYDVSVDLPNGNPDLFATETGGGVSGGAYKIGGLLAGVAYKVKFITGPTNPNSSFPGITAFYCEAAKASAAIPLMVTSGADLPIINQKLWNPGAKPPKCPSPSATEIGSALDAGMAVGGPPASIAAILKSRSYPAVANALTAGNEKITWYYLPAGAHIARVVKPIVVATASHRFNRAGPATIKLRLTSKGRALLKKSKHVKLTAVGTFKPKHGKTATKHLTLTLK